ncbi:polymorphic toxin type 47 domain-containing protein [Thermogemmatispora sp.]
MGHKLDGHGPADPHVGYQTPGKRSAGGALRGHIPLDEVPVNRPTTRE